MKDEKFPPVEAPDGASLPCRSRPAAPRLPVLRITIAALLVLTQGMILVSQGQTLPLPGLDSKVAPAQPPSLVSLVAQGRRQPGYQMFAGHLALPAITILDAATLSVGGTLTIDVSQLDQLTSSQKETLAGLFAVPVGVVDKLLVNSSSPVPTDAAQWAEKFRIAVIDYRYLLERWNQYRPPVGKEQVKTDALLALQAGETSQAWELYAGVARPKPPGGIRIAGGN